MGTPGAGAAGRGDGGGMGVGAAATAGVTAEVLTGEAAVPLSAGAATGAGAAPGGEGMVNVFWHVGQAIRVPIIEVSHAIFWPHSGQKNLNSLIRLL